MDKLDLRLLFRFLDEEISVADDLFGLLLDLFDIANLREELCVVLAIEFLALLGEELFAHISSLVELLRSQLDIDEVSLLKDLVHFVHLLPL